jgi:hypothetical protein
MTGFTLNNGSCISCNVSNCKACGSTINICETCLTGYSIVQGQCVLCNVSRCTKCIGVNICGNCSSATTFTNTGSSCFYCQDLNCKTCSADNIC